MVEHQEKPLLMQVDESGSDYYDSAARTLIENYYTALKSARTTIASFYTPAAMLDGKPLPIIVFNGNTMTDAAAMQKMFEDMPPAIYVVQCYDCQVINPNYVGIDSEDGACTYVRPRRNMSILVSVSGYAKYGESREATKRGFSENFVLIPNPAAIAGNVGRNQREWLIQSQNFRLVT